MWWYKSHDTFIRSGSIQIFSSIHHLKIYVSIESHPICTVRSYIWNDGESYRCNRPIFPRNLSANHNKMCICFCMLCVVYDLSIPLIHKYKVSCWSRSLTDSSSSVFVFWLSLQFFQSIDNARRNQLDWICLNNNNSNSAMCVHILLLLLQCGRGRIVCLCLLHFVDIECVSINPHWLMSISNANNNKKYGIVSYECEGFNYINTNEYTLTHTAASRTIWIPENVQNLIQSIAVTISANRSKKFFFLFSLAQRFGRFGQNGERKPLWMSYGIEA